MAHMEPTFSINRHDRDGDVFDEGVFLHFGDTSVKVADSIADFKSFKIHISSMEQEIIENYS